MVDAVGPIALLIAAIVATWLVVRWRRQAVEDYYERGDRIRKIVTVLAVALIAWTFIRSGDPLLILAALLGAVAVTVFFLVEKPWEDVV